MSKFQAIGIRTEQDIDMMKSIFLPYAVCDICEGGKGSRQSLASEEAESEEKNGNYEKKKKTKSAAEAEDSILLPQEETCKDFPDRECQASHPLRIEKIYVLKALRNFVANFHADNGG